MQAAYRYSDKKRFLMSVLPWLICALGGLFYVYEYVLRITPGVITGELMQYFNINALMVSNLAAFYYYAYTPMQLPVGILMDRFGPRKLLSVACLLCAFGSYLFASTPHFMLAGIGRFFVGFGSAFAFVGVLKLAAIWLPEDRFAFISGLTSALGALGAAVGMVVMQLIVNHVSWQRMIDITGFLGLILAVLLFLVIRDRPKRILGQYETIHWREVLLGFYKILKNPAIWITGFVGCLLYLPASVFAELWGKTFLMSTHHMTADEAVFGVSLVFVGFAIGGPFFGYFSDKIKNRRWPIFTGACTAACLFFLLLYLPMDFNHTLLFGLLFCFGAAYGAQVIVFAISREISPIASAATALAVTNMIVMLSGSIFETVVGEFLKQGWGHHFHHGIPVYSATDFQSALLVIPFGLLLGAVLILFVKETHAQCLGDE